MQRGKSEEEKGKWFLARHAVIFSLDPRSTHGFLVLNPTSWLLWTVERKLSKILVHVVNTYAEVKGAIFFLLCLFIFSGPSSSNHYFNIASRAAHLNSKSVHHNLIVHPNSISNLLREKFVFIAQVLALALIHISKGNV